MNTKVLFVFDRVAHYHRDLFIELRNRLPFQHMELYLLSGEVPKGATGRVGLRDRVIELEEKYIFYEWTLRNFTIRKHDGVLEKLRHLKPDLVVLLGHAGNISYWRLLGLKRKLGIKFIAWQCGYEFNPGKLKDFVLRHFIPRFDYHLAYHTNAKKFALRYGAKENQVTVIHNTINEEKIALLPKEKALSILRAMHPEIGERKIILYVGALLEEKKLPTVLNALNLLARNDTVFVVVGDGPYRKELERMAQGRKDVIFTGQVIEGVGMYFDAADCFILPGTGGLAINEAMAHGLPILSGYADGSADDLVIDGMNGYRLQTGTEQEIAFRIQRVFDDEVMRGAMGAESRRMIREQFSFKQFIERVCAGLSEADKQH